MADKNHLILTAVGPDQVGQWKKSPNLLPAWLNIEDSMMTVFCEEFALLILISGEGGNLYKIAIYYHELEIEAGLAEMQSKRPHPASWQNHVLPSHS